MADQEQRAEESRRDDDDKFHQEREAERAERARLAEGLDEDPAPRDDD
jgi:hypothetical protein